MPSWEDRCKNLTLRAYNWCLQNLKLITCICICLEAVEEGVLVALSDCRYSQVAFKVISVQVLKATNYIKKCIYTSVLCNYLIINGPRNWSAGPLCRYPLHADTDVHQT